MSRPSRISMRLTRIEVQRCRSIGEREALAALHPLLAGENSGCKFDQAREHVENGHRPPLATLAGTVALAGKFFGDLRERNILDDELHHGEQELHLVRIFFQVIAVPSYANAVGRLFEPWLALAWGGRSFGFALPFDADQPPASFFALLYILR